MLLSPAGVILWLSKRLNPVRFIVLVGKEEDSLAMKAVSEVSHYRWVRCGTTG